MSMDYRLLGPFEVYRSGGPVAIGAGKRRALLAVLLLHANEVVPTDRLIDDLWPERPPATAANAVQVYVSQLRKDLGARNGQILTTRPNGYVLQVADEDLDVRRFENGIAAGERALARGEAARAADLLRGALSLWRGPPLLDFAYESFAQREIMRLEERRLTAVERRIDADLALGRHAPVVSELEVLVGEHPFREGLRASLMLALYRCGRQAEALSAYREGRARMVEELGIEPGPQLRRLEAGILAHSPELALPMMRERGAGPASDADAAAAPPTQPRGDRTAAAPRRRSRRPYAALVAVVVILAGVVATEVLVAPKRQGADDPGPTRTALDLAPDSVAVVDGASGAPRFAVPLVGRPTDLAAADGVVWAATVNSASVTAVDARSRTIERVVPLRMAPGALAVGYGMVWVADGRRGELAAVREGYDDVSAPIRFSGGRPGDGLEGTSVAVGAGGVWVSDGSSTLARVDPRTRRVTAIATGRRLTGVAAGAGAVWAISATSRSLLRLDPGTNRVTDRLRLSRAGDAGPVPAAIAATADAVWVLNLNTASVVRIDPATASIAAVIPIGADRVPNAIAAGRRTVWVANDDGSLSRIDTATNTVSSVEVGEPMRQVAVDGIRLWVATTALDQQLPGGVR
jgi:DNA-binding SARP family transcriptional activator